MIRINERTSSVVSLVFTDENKRPTIPSSGRYQVSDLATNTVLATWTNFSPVTSAYDIPIDFTNNRIIDDSNEIEVRVVSIVLQYGDGKQCTAEYQYEIENLHDVPPAYDLVAGGGAVSGGLAVISYP